MNVRFPRRFVLASLLGLSACGSSEPLAFDTPESVLYAAADDVYLVSNINGAPLAHDNNGYISRARADGTGERYWIRGGHDGVTLDAPKGMAVVDNILWVADINKLRKFDRVTGEALGHKEIEGATFLNDVSAAPDGTVFVTDSGLDENFEPTGTDAIWRLPPGGELEPLIQGPDLGNPNGLVALATGVYVVNWRDGAFFQVDNRGVRMDMGKAPQAKLDGLVRVLAGQAGTIGSNPPRPVWYATSWVGSCIYRFDLTGGCTALPVRLEQPADLGFDSKRNLLVVPLFGENRLHSQRL